jgi:hypothetical protein
MKSRPFVVAALLLTISSLACGGPCARSVADSTEPTPVATSPQPPAAADSPAPAPAPAVAFERVTTAAYDGVIAPESVAFVPGRFFEHEVQGLWTPSAAEVDAFEAGIDGFLQGANPALSAKFAPYKRQYTGLLQGADKRIWAAFFCRTMDGWENNLIGVDDGGDCYFQVLYDVASGAYLLLDVNGEA